MVVANFGSPQWNYQQFLQNQKEQAEQEAYNYWLTEQNMGLQAAGLQNQIANQNWQNAAQGVYNANAVSGAKSQKAATGLNLAENAQQRNLQKLRALGDIAQQKVAQDRYLSGLALDVARQRQNELEAAQRRANMETGGGFNRSMRAFGY